MIQRLMVLEYSIIRPDFFSIGLSHAAAAECNGTSLRREVFAISALTVISLRSKSMAARSPFYLSGDQARGYIKYLKKS